MILCSFKLSKIYKQGKLEVVALNNVNFSIYAGEIVVIMGPSGSGKTTLINCIAGMEQPTAGSVLLRDYEVSKLNDYGKELLLKYEVGIVYQFFNLIPNLTAKNNIELPMMLAKQKKSYIKNRVKVLLNMVGLENQAGQHPNTLSGGEKQRVGIAMALANDPPIILADEPTANVDSISANNRSFLLGLCPNSWATKPNQKPPMVVIVWCSIPPPSSVKQWPYFSL